VPKLHFGQISIALPHAPRDFAHRCRVDGERPRRAAAGDAGKAAAGAAGVPTLAPGTLRLLRKMERAGAIEDRLLAQRVVMEEKRSRLRLETEAEEMQGVTFTPNVGARSPTQAGKVDVAALAQRLHDAGTTRHERHRLLQVHAREREIELDTHVRR
jgi:hypothetical protein